MRDARSDSADSRQAGAVFERVGISAPAAGELVAATLADGSRVCVGNADGQLFGVQDACTHAAFPLSEGTLLGGGVLQCNWHGARFDCRSGIALQEPAFDPLERYDVRAAGGAIWIRKAS